MNSVRIDRQEIRNYNWGERLPSHTIQYADVINFERSSMKLNRSCVLCGVKESEKDGCLIPKQNKGVCRKCDSTYWLLKKLGVIVKFCKGCKLFFSLVDFDGKPNTTKCGTCRKRGRDNYHGKMERKRHCEKVTDEFCTAGTPCTNGSDSDTTMEDDDDFDSEKVFSEKKKRKVSHSSSPQNVDERSMANVLLGMDNLCGREISPMMAGPWSLLSSEEKEKLICRSSLQTSPTPREDEAAASLLLAASGQNKVKNAGLRVPLPSSASVLNPPLPFSAVTSPRVVSAAHVMQRLKNGMVL